MKRKRKIQLAAETLTFVMLISSCQKTLKLVKEVRNPVPQNKSFTTSAVLENEKGQQHFIIVGEASELKEQLIPITAPTAELETKNLETWAEETLKQPPIETQQNMAHTTTSVNMRCSNTTDALIINNLQINEKVYKILSCENNWDLVKYNGQIGYICRDYLNYSGETTETKYQYTPKKDIALTSEDLNFRPTPSTEVKSITRFGKGEEIEVIAEVNNGWYLVKSNGKLGYVHGDYITSLLDRANEQYPELNLTELETKKVVYAKTGINIRNGVGEEYEQIGSLEEFETVRVMKEYDDWYFVMTNDYNFGFIHKEYTEELNDKFIIVDISEQRLWQYNNSTLYYTTPVTTGMDGHESDIGKTNVHEKAMNCELSGDDYGPTIVTHWIGINDDGEGIHEAKWRYKFGKEVNYHQEGSHGCTNAPPEIMPDIFDATAIGDTVVVHK